MKKQLIKIKKLFVVNDKISGYLGIIKKVFKLGISHYSNRSKML
jgi:hypothetical protein